MGWKEQLKPASFRGVPFRVETNKTDGGQRMAVHKYPLRKGIYAEGLGEEPDQFSINAYLIGQDYIAARDAVIDAMRKPDAGTLILPTWPSKKVKPVSWSVDYDKEKGGIEFLTLAFIEAGDLIYPNPTTNTGGLVTNAANQLQTTIAQSFQRVFSI